MSLLRFVYQMRRLNNPIRRQRNINHWILPVFIYCNYTGYEMIKSNKN